MIKDIRKDLRKKLDIYIRRFGLNGGAKRLKLSYITLYRLHTGRSGGSWETWEKIERALKSSTV